MRIFRFWTQIKTTIHVGNHAQEAHCCGGSNISMEDAVRDAHVRMGRALERLSGKKLNPDEYEADIREEVLTQIDGQNIVTRTRYGAEVLNSTSLMFLDMDEPKLGFWDSFLMKKKIGARAKESIVDFVKKKMTKPEFRDLGMRLYETHKGIRGIVTGRSFNPKSNDTLNIMREFNTDGIYVYLCKRQACFRARLTPKPYRMKIRTIKIRFPRPNPEIETQITAWVTDYNQTKTRFSTCKFICNLGASAPRNAVVDYHDQATGAFSNLPLA